MVIILLLILSHACQGGSLVILRLACFIVVLIVLDLGVRCYLSEQAEANHNIYLPYVPNTPLMQQVITQQEYTYCLDSRTASYPNFRSQLADVVSQYQQRTGIRGREVAFSDLACQVKHTMPDTFPCGSGAAACIYYGNWPVEIPYKHTLNYTDWRSAQGHELGHGLLGLHEMYNDSSGNIGCTGRQDTVMDCGSGVRYPTSLDVSRACLIIKTAWCGNIVPACQQYPGNPGWNDCINRWVFADGWSVDPKGNNACQDDDWYNPASQLEWKGQNSDGLRANELSHLFFYPSGAAFDWDRGVWLAAPAC